MGDFKMSLTSSARLATAQRSVLRFQPLMSTNNRVLASQQTSSGDVMFALGLSNVRQRAELGWGTDESQDPKGCVLRQLRLDSNEDPASLATRACVSVKQLFALEKGLPQPFPSETLRRQAGRKVAQILGVDWDAL
jgi:hypothetical protein